MSRVPERYNATLSTATEGSYDVWCSAIVKGISINAAEGEASMRRVFYPQVITSSSFTAVLIFRSWRDRDQFDIWLSGFMTKVATGKGFQGSMKFDVPDLGFTRVAVPTGTIERGEGLTDVGYSMTLKFIGATDPTHPMVGSKKTGISYFRLPTRQKEVAKYFYPAGQQVRGAATFEGSLFDGVGLSATISNPDQEDPTPYTEPIASQGRGDNVVEDNG